MKQIWKYEFAVQDDVTLSMPRGAKILTVQDQRGAVTMWAEIDPAAPREKRRFRVVGTGESLDPNRLQYLGTAQFGVLVWHVYEHLDAATFDR